MRSEEPRDSLPEMSLPTLYIETTIPSYLTARRSRDLRLAADHETTEEWWNMKRQAYDLYTSETVVLEAAQGEASFRDITRELFG